MMNYELHQVLVTDAFVLNDAAYGLSKHLGHTDLLHLGATLCVGTRVGKDNLVEG